MVSEKAIETLVRFAGPLVDSGMLSKADLEELRNINHPPQKNIEIPVLISMQEAAKMLKVTVKCIYDYAAIFSLIFKINSEYIFELLIKSITSGKLASAAIHASNLSLLVTLACSVASSAS